MDFFGLKRKRYWNRVFSNCDFDFAKDLLVQSFGGGVIPKDLTPLLDAFVNRPCRETAMDLIQYDIQEFQKYFTNNINIQESMLRTSGICAEELSRNLPKNEGTLRADPEFIEYCRIWNRLAEFAETDVSADLNSSLKSNLDDIFEKKSKLESALTSKGYSISMINDVDLISSMNSSMSDNYDK